MVIKYGIAFEAFVEGSVSWSPNIWINVFYGPCAFDVIYTKRKFLTFIDAAWIAYMI
jgi:hypothetical protein